MTILKYVAIVIILLVVGLYLFWLKLKKGKPGRVAGADVEKKTYEEALVIDVRWRKEYARGHALNAINIPIKVLREGSKVLDSYKDKEIILYCVVDVTSRNTEKILRERGFTKLHIGDGMKQYDYGNPGFKNVLMAEMKYLRTATEHTLLNVGDEELESSEIKLKYEDLESSLHLLPKEKVVFVYSNNEKKSLEASKYLVSQGYEIINLIEPFDSKKYTFTTYKKSDFVDNPADEQVTDCG